MIDNMWTATVALVLGAWWILIVLFVVFVYAYVTRNRNVEN